MEIYRNRYAGLTWVDEPCRCNMLQAPPFHLDAPGLSSEAWHQLLRVIDEAAADGRDERQEEFSLGLCGVVQDLLLYRQPLGGGAVA